MSFMAGPSSLEQSDPEVLRLLGAVLLLAAVQALRHLDVLAAQLGALPVFEIQVRIRM